MMDFQAFSPCVVPLAVVLGLLVGSFLNVVIYRIPVIMERGWTTFSKEHLNLPLSDEEKQPFNLMLPKSRCPKCHAGVKAWQNIPVISYLFLGGRCASCRTPISKRYPLVEILTALLFGIVAWRYGWSMLTFGGLVFTAMLLALTFIDADTQYLPDSLTLPLIWLGLLFNYDGTFVSLQQAVLGAVFGYMSLWSLNYIHKLIRGMDGMGGGDFKLLAALGAWMGVSVLPIIVLVAALVGVIAAVILKAAKSQPIAFGPCLAIAGWLAFAGYEDVMMGVNWWLRASGFTV